MRTSNQAFAGPYGLWTLNLVGAATHHFANFSPRFYVLQAGLAAVIGLALWIWREQKTPSAAKHAGVLIALSVALDLAVMTGVLESIPG